MIEAGLVSQKQDKKDKRYNLVHITKKGEELKYRATRVLENTQKSSG